MTELLLELGGGIHDGHNPHEFATKPFPERLLKALDEKAIATAGSSM
jgi:hypothetical protein